MMRRIVSVISQFALVSSLLLPQATVLATTVESEEPGCETVDWQPVPDCFADPVGEPGIGTDYSDLVGTQDYPAAFYCFDEDESGYAHFRERVVEDATTRHGFKNAAWVVLLDFDTTEGYEYLISVSGKYPEWVSLFSNPVGSRQIPFLLDPTNVDKAEVLLGTQYPAVVPYAEASRDDSGNYCFVTWAVPIQMLIDNMPEIDDAADFNELIESGQLHLYYGTAEDNNNYNKDVLDCCTPSLLTVCKVVVNDDGGTATAHDWDIVIFDADGNAVATQRPVSNEDNCVTFSLSGGTYTIVEVGPEDYVASYSGDSSDGTITLATEEEASVTITNDDAPATATVTLHKTVINDGAGTLTADDFQAYLDGNPVAWGTAIDVLPGSHTVSEDSEPGYSASDWSGDCDASGNLTVEPGESYDCYITNDDADTKAKLTVCKVVVSNDGGDAVVSDFTFVISDAGGEVDRGTPASEQENCVTFTLDAGTYTISEEGPAGYAPVFSGDSTDGTIVLTAGDDKTVTVTNDDFDPTITICKVLINDDGGQAEITDWTFVVTDSEGVEVGRQSPASEQEPCVSFILPVGTYTIAEEGPSGYVATFSGDCTTDGTVYLALGDSKTVTVTNDDDEPGSGYTISGHKYCCGDGECSDTGIEGWEITLVGPLEDEPVQRYTTLTDENGYYEFTGLAAGTYVVSETSIDNWESCTPEDATIVVGPGSGAIYSTPGETEYQDGSSWLPSAASWEPQSGVDPSYWDAGLTGHSFTDDADWVWESYRVQHPVSGDVVTFRHEFSISGSPEEGDLWITADNGYEVYLNGTFVGSAQVHDAYGTDWQDSSLREAWVNRTNWQSVEHFDVSSLLVSGVNTLTIEAANEYMGTDEYPYVNGTVDSNPAGIIFELVFTTNSTEHYTVDFCNAPVAEASSNSPVCEGSDIELFGSPAGMDSYSWTGPNGYESDEKNPVIADATLDNAGEYTLTITSKGCSASASTTVTLSDAPDADASAEAESVCVGSDIELLGGPTGTGLTYAWSGPADFTSNQQNPVIPNATESMEGVYTLIVETASGCTGEDTVTITVTTAPTADFEADDTSVCVDYAVTFTDHSTGSPTTWAWDFGDGATSALQNPTHAYAAAGTYTVTLTVANDCGSDDEIKTVYITVNPTPVVTVTADPATICAGYSTTLTADTTGTECSGSLSFQWYLGNSETGTAVGTDSSSYTTPELTETTTYTCVVTCTGTGCSAEDDVTITVNDCATVTLHKIVDNLEGGTAVADDFQPYIDGLTQIYDQDVAWETPITLPAGSYTVSEDCLPGYEPSDWTGDCEADGDLTIESGGEYHCYITNTGPGPNADFEVEVYEWVESSPSLSAVSTSAPSQKATSSSSESLWPRTSAGHLPLEELLSIPVRHGSVLVQTQTVQALGDVVSPSAPEEPEGIMVCAGMRVLFTDLSSPSPCGTLIRWEWDFDNDGTIELTWTPFSGDVLLWTWDRDDDGTPDEFQLGVKATFEWVYAEPGTYTVRLEVTEDLGGTDSEVKVNYVTVSPSPTVSIETSAGSWTVFVDELPVTLTAATVSDCTIESYEWRQVGVGVVGSEPTYTLPDTTPPGEYEFTVIVTCSSNCKDMAKATVVILDSCQPVAPDFGVCQGTALDDDLFTVNGAICYDSDGVASFSLDYSNVNTQTPGEYQYTVTCGTPCPSEPAVGTVTVYPLPTADAGSDHTIVAGDSLHIGGIPTASGGTPYDAPPEYEYSWTPTTGLEDPSAANPLATPGTTTTYTVVVTDSHGCSDSDSVTITVLTPCEPTAPDFGVCQGTVLDDALFIDHGAACYDESGAVSVDLDYTNVNTNVPGEYQYMVMCAGPCVTAPAYGTVTVYPLPTASFTVTPDDGNATLTVAFDDNSTVPAGGTIVLWEWDLDNDPDIDRTDGPSAPGTFQRSYGSAGTYTVSLTVTTDHGCTDTTTRVITVRSTPRSGGGDTWEPGDPQCFFDVDMMGEVTRVWVTCDDGRCLADYEPDDPEDANFLELSKGTRVTFERDGEFNGGPPRWVRMTESKSTPAMPEGTVNVTAVYDFLGYTTTGLVVDSVFFDRPVGMLLDYDPDSLPENTVSVGIAVWDTENSEWIIQPQSTGQVAGVGTATADVMHFSKFVVLATTDETVEDAPTTASAPAASGFRPANYVGSDLLLEPAIESLWGPLTFVTRTGNSVTVTATISNIGDESGTYTAELLLNGEAVGTQDVSLAGGEARQVKFVVSNVSGGDYRVQIAGLEGSFSATQVVNWMLVLLLAAILAVPVALLLYADHRRRKAPEQTQE